MITPGNDIKSKILSAIMSARIVSYSCKASGQMLQYQRHPAQGIINSVYQ